MSTRQQDLDAELKKEADLKKFFELQENNKRSEAQEEEYHRLLAAYGKEIIKNPDMIKGKKQEEVNYAIQGIQQDIFKQIIKDYEEKTGRKIEERDGKPCFTFPSQEDAVSFFEDQAKQGRPFQVYCKEKDHCIYSDGTNFVHGTLKEVEAYKKNPEAFELGEHGALKAKEPQEQEQQTTAPTL